MTYRTRIKRIVSKLSTKDDDINLLNSTVEDLRTQLKYREQECEKHKQALNEIEEIMKKTNGECFYHDINDCENCDMNYGCSAFNLHKMINIISKTKEQ